MKFFPAVIRAYLLIKFGQKLQYTFLLGPPLRLETQEYVKMYQIFQVF